MVNICLMRTPFAFLLILALSFGFGTSASEKPNVLLIMVDDLNDWLGVNGESGHSQAITPNLDRLCEQGMYFANAHCSAPICGASRFSLISGLLPSTTDYYVHSPLEGRLDEYRERGYRMLPEYLKSQGYRTMGGGKLYHRGTRDLLEVDDWSVEMPHYVLSEAWLEKGHFYAKHSAYFHPFPKGGSQIIEYGNGFSLCGGPLDPEDMPDGRMPDELIADWAVERLGEEGDEPFFLAVGLVRPHVPFTAPRRFFELYDEDSIELPEVLPDDLADVPRIARANAMGILEKGDHAVVMEMGEDYWRLLVHSYLASVSFVDSQIGRVLKALDDSRYASNTIVILTSDHGQHLGEKAKWRKMSLWEESTRVPLVVAFPDDRNAGARLEEAVSLLDLAPTILDLAGLEPLKQHEGESLVPLLDDPSARREAPAITTWLYGNHSVRDERWRYTRYRDGSEELYDHSKDPMEFENLAGREEFAEVIEGLKRWLPEDRPLASGAKAPGDDSIERVLKIWDEDPSQVPGYLR